MSILAKKQEAQKLNDLPKERNLLNRRTGFKPVISDSKACTLPTIRWKLATIKGWAPCSTQREAQPVSRHAGWLATRL